MRALSIIIPVYNEQDLIDICYKRIKEQIDTIENITYEIIFIDDGSNDNTNNKVSGLAKKDKSVKLISFSRNFGHQAAVSCGLKNSKGDIIVVIDSDMQDPPELILDMIKLWEKGNKIVIPVRKIRKGETKFKIYSANMFYKMLNKISDINITENAGDFRLLDRQVVDVINSLPEHNKYLRGLYSYVGFKQAKINYERDERIAGKTKYNLSKMFKLALDGIIGFSTKPLKIVGFLGFTSVCISILLFVYAIVSYITKINNILSGWTSIIITLVFFGGVQLISLWIISEYIARIYSETKNRPDYIIEEKVNFEE
jgi:polyisoprenyl-phosphate glycosyltransferase